MGVLVNMGGGRSSDSSLKEFCDGDIILVSDLAELTDGDSTVNKSIFGAL